MPRAGSQQASAARAPPRGSQSHPMHAPPFATASQRHPHDLAVSPTDPLSRPPPGSHTSLPPFSHGTASEPSPPSASGAGGASVEPSYPPPPYTLAVQQQIHRHQRMLLFLRHCAKCADPVACPYGWRCGSGKTLWQHIFSCSNPRCKFPNCVQARQLLRHYQKCRDAGCPICGPVREFLLSPQGQSGGLPPSMS